MVAFSKAALAAVAALAAGASGASFQYKDRYACGVCQELQAGSSCSSFGEAVCAAPYASAPNCEEVCKVASAQSAELAAAPANLEVRVAKGLGKRSYDQVRISVITDSPEPPAENFFDYSAQFKYKWTQHYLHTALKSIKGSEVFDFGTNVTVRLPAQGQGVAGILLADPCVNSPTGKMWIGCMFGDKHQTITRIPELINTFGGSEDTDFWSISGDNFYDRTGEITQDVYRRISLDVKSKVFNSVPGNHDYWVLGDPDVSTEPDQCGYGFMQYYGQDVKAGENVTAGSDEAPFDLSKDPHESNNGTLPGGCKKSTNQNFLWYHQLGNLGMVGQSGAFSLNDTEPFMREACTWLSEQPGLDVVVLFGHWDMPGLGASEEMAMPKWYVEMSALPGCQEYNERGMLKFVMGHTHCNDPHPHGEMDTGFRVAGFGMEGCGNFGMPIVDTTDGLVRFWYFDTDDDAKYNTTVACVKQNGWRQCTQHAILWLNQTLVPKPQAEVFQGVTISV